MTNVFDRIVVPLDGSELAESALAQATEFAILAEGELILATVLDGTVGGEFAHRAHAEHISETDEITRYLDGLKAEARGAGCRAHCVQITDPDPATGLLRIIDGERATAVVMSTHGRSGVGRWLLGSVAEKVARAAPCTVVIVRTP